MKNIYLENFNLKSSPTKLINIRIEKNLHEFIKKEALNNNLTIKNLVLYSTLNKIKESRAFQNIYLIDDINIKRLIFQIKKIGININQIAKKLNSSGEIDTSFNKLVEEFKIIEKEITTFKEHTRKIE